jgi:hypothetical protein
MPAKTFALLLIGVIAAAALTLAALFALPLPGWAWAAVAVALVGARFALFYRKP